MSSSLLRGQIWLRRKLPTGCTSPQQACVSTASAINRGLRATKDDGREYNGARHRSVEDRRASRDVRIPKPVAQDRRRLSAYIETGHQTTSREKTFASAAKSGLRHRQSQDVHDFRPSGPGRREQLERSTAPVSQIREKSSEFSVIDTSPPRKDSDFGFRGQPNSRPQPKPAEGLLKAIKNACRQIHFLQQQQESGEAHGIEDLVRDARASLQIVNTFISSGTFEQDEPAEAVVSLFRKKARAGTFLAGAMPDGKKSVIYVTRDGAIDLSVCKTEGLPSKPRRKISERDDHPAERRKNERRDLQNSERSGQLRRVGGEDDGIPVSIPYTTAASEFLYGYNSVLAALKAKRRKMYKLYIHPKIFDADIGGQGTCSGEKPASELVNLAKAAGIPFRNEFRTAMLDKMSDGRPHNGVILEASRLPTLPILSLWKSEPSRGLIPVVVDQQRVEDAKIRGKFKDIDGIRSSWRHPFIVMLDGIKDPGNVGNIIRTCHFYGVDAVVIATNTCANLSSAILAKASSGACEAVSLLTVSQPSNFIFESQKYRWKVYAAVAPNGKTNSSERFLSTSSVSANSPLAKHPCILMLGAEGEGLRQNLLNRAEYFVSIEGGQRADGVPDVGVDSMNVSVATGVLLESFLRKPAGVAKTIGNADES